MWKACIEILYVRYGGRVQRRVLALEFSECLHIPYRDSSSVRFRGEKLQEMLHNNEGWLEISISRIYRTEKRQTRLSIMLLSSKIWVRYLLQHSSECHHAMQISCDLAALLLQAVSKHTTYNAGRKHNMAPCTCIVSARCHVMCQC